MVTETASVTRRQYEDLRGRLYQKRQTLLRALSQASGAEYDRIWTALGQSRELPRLPGAWVYMLYEPDGTYMGTVRTRAEIRALEEEGLTVTVRRARDLHPDLRPVPARFARLVQEVQR